MYKVVEPYTPHIDIDTNSPGYPGNNIDGWMTLQEQKLLYELASQCETVLEIGSWKGKSAHAIASGCKGTVYCVDINFNEPIVIVHDKDKGRKQLDVFRENTAQFKNIVTYATSSEEAAKQFADKSIDMIFIDGDHSYEAVKQDILLWRPKAKLFFSGHDFSSDWPGVMQAVDELVPSFSIVGSIWCHLLNTKTYE